MACKDGRWSYLDFVRRIFNVNQIVERLAVERAGAATAVITIICGVFAATLAWSAPIGSPGRGPRIKCALQLAAEPATAPAPASETNEEDDKDVPTSQIDKYISVDESVHKDDKMTVYHASFTPVLTRA